MKTFYTVAVVGLIMMSVGCASLPKTTRTGEIHQISIGENLSPAEITVKVGEEVRWVNSRSLDSHIYFLPVTLKNLSCQKGFTNNMENMQESVTLKPNQSASLCFSTPTEVRYNVRMGAVVPGGDKTVSGIILVTE
jgi:plastocyanin